MGNMNYKKIILTAYCLWALLVPCDRMHAGDVTNDDIKAKREVRAKNFGQYLLYWCDRSAYYDINAVQLGCAKHRNVARVNASIPKLVQDSTYYANQILEGADIINDMYEVHEKYNMPFVAYSLIRAYKEAYPSKDSPEYTVGHSMYEYERVLKKLKLARYSLRVNHK